MQDTLPLSSAKARFSEVVRTVRRTGQAVLITVDGEPAARITPARGSPRDLTPQEMATVRALTEAVGRAQKPSPSFDAVDLVREGRR